MFKKIRSGKKQNWKRQQERQEEAIARQEAYDKLTSEQKLAKLNKAGYKATKQRAKLKVGA